MEEAKTLIIMVGLPRSGKTTWARAHGAPIVNPDSIRLAMHGQRFAAEAERWVWAQAHTMVRALFLAGHSTVIVDGTHVISKRRQEWKDAFEAPTLEVQFRVIGTAPDVCRQRAQQLGDTEILPVIDRMAAEWDLPGHAWATKQQPIKVGDGVFRRQSDLFATVKAIVGECAIVKPEWPHDGSTTEWRLDELRLATPFE